jgi:DNA-binding MurR/RpiR family transcriptional regulator
VTMEVKIGVIYSARELSVELDGKADEIVANVEAALANGAPILWMTDKKGRRVGVPADKVAYVEIGEEDTAKGRVGFGPG